MRSDSGWLGMSVRPARDVTIPFENPFTGEVSYEAGSRYTTEDVFVVEHDFRPSGEKRGIRVACPARDGSSSMWMSLTSDEFADMFGAEALAKLDAMSG